MPELRCLNQGEEPVNGPNERQRLVLSLARRSPHE